MAINKRKILQSAQKHQAKGAFDKALRDYETLLRADPRDANVRLKVGDIHLKQGKRHAAVTAYLKVADQFMRDGFDAKAVALYKQINKIDPDRLDVYAPLAELYERLGLASDALRALQTAADAHYREGRKKEALDLLRRMASLDPSNTVSRLKVAELLRQEGRGDEALAEYEAAAEELERRGEGEERVRVLEKMVELDPDHGGALEQLARAYAQERRWPDAERAARRRTQADPDAPGGWEVLGEALRNQGRDAEVPEVYRTLAEIHRRRGEEDRARELMQRYVSTGALGEESSEEPVLETDDELVPDTGPAAAGETPESEHAGLGDLDLGAEGAGGEARAGEDPNAAGLSSLPPLPRTDPPPAPRAPAPSAASRPPAAGEAEGEVAQQLTEAKVYLRYGKLERAVESLRAALRRDPDHRDVLEHLAEALERSGEPADAAEALRRAGERAAQEGDAEGVERVRGRLENLDPDAARALPEPAAPASPGAVEEEIELEELDVEVGSEAETGGREARASGDATAVDSPDEEEIDVSDLSGPEEPLGGETPAAPAPAPPPPRAAAPAASVPPQRIAEDLEEADFYVQQELYDEAEALYRRVLETVPGQPQALLRLREIEARRRGEAAPAAAPGPAAGAESLPPLERPSQGGFADEGWERELNLEVEAAPAPAEDDTPTPAAPPEPEPEPKPPAATVRLERPAPPTSGATPRAGALPQAEVTEPTVGEATAPFDAEGEERSGAEAEIDLDEPRAPAPSPAAAGVAPPERSEAGAFDLAAELSGVFEEEDPAPGLRAAAGAPGGTTEEEGFEAVFAAFKQGVSKELDASDYEAHYDLGIAYREMGLLEDAIEEFRVSSGGESRRLPALHMLGLCALDLGRAVDAVAHIEQALSLSDVPEEQRAALRFDLGRAYEEQGELARAREAYETVAEIDPDFGQVRARLEALARREADSDEGAAPGEVEPEEALESFDDLLAEVDAEAESAPGEPAYESFDDLLEEEPEEGPAAGAPGSGSGEAGGEEGESSGGGREGRPRRRKISFV